MKMSTVVLFGPGKARMQDIRFRQLAAGGICFPVHRASGPTQIVFSARRSRQMVAALTGVFRTIYTGS